MKKTVDDIKVSELITLALKGVALAMGVAVVVLSFLNEIETTSAIGMLGLGLACLAVTQLPPKCRSACLCTSQTTGKTV